METQQRTQTATAPRRFVQRSTRRLQDRAGTRLARGLGWFSLGLGLAELAAPRGLTKLMGIKHRPRLLRALGLRESATGVGILTRRRPEPRWLWARVAGDAVDLALLSAAFTGARKHRNRVAAAAGAVLGVTLLDIFAGQRRRRATAATTIPAGTSVTVNRAVEECYQFWHDLTNLPRFMRHLESVHVDGPGRSHWVVKAPAGRTVEWDAEITDDQPNNAIAWRSLPGAEVESSGVVQFERAPGGRGTVVRVQMQYRPPGGRAGAWAAKLFGESPDLQIRDDLRRYKQIIETGEIPTTRGQPQGTRSLVGRAFTKGVEQS